MPMPWWAYLLPYGAGALQHLFGGGADIQEQFGDVIGRAGEDLAWESAQKRKRQSLLDPLIGMRAGRIGQQMKGTVPFSRSDYMNALTGDVRDTFQDPGAAPPSITTDPYSYESIDITDPDYLKSLDPYGGKKRSFFTRGDIVLTSEGNKRKEAGGRGPARRRLNRETGEWEYVDDDGNVLGTRTVTKNEQTQIDAKVIKVDDGDDFDIVDFNEEGDRPPPDKKTPTVTTEVPGGELAIPTMRSRRDIMELANRVNTQTQRPPVSLPPLPEMRAKGMAGQIPELAGQKAGLSQQAGGMLPQLLELMKKRKPLTGGLIR